jgi:DNA-binding LytR/AlgR family response regulator
MSMRIGILEDELLIAEHLSELIMEKDYELVFCVDNFKEAKEEVKKGVDFLMLDIKIAGEQDGIDFANYIKSKLNIPFLFISSNVDEETLQRVIQAKPYGFLSKPFKNIDVEMALDLAMEKFIHSPEHSNSKKAIFLKDKGSWIKFELDNILYIEASDNYSIIYLSQKSEVLITKNLKYFEENLPSNQFIRINRSNIINKNFVTQFDTKNIYIDNIGFSISDTININELKF